MSIGTLVGWALFGLVAGAIARFLHPGRDPMNWLWTMILGIGGALAGGYLADLMGFDARGGFASWVAAIGGAVLLLIVYHMLTAGRSAVAGPAGSTATSDDYKKAVFDDLSRGPNG